MYSYAVALQFHTGYYKCLVYWNYGHQKPCQLFHHKVSIIYTECLVKWVVVITETQNCIVKCVYACRRDKEIGKYWMKSAKIARRLVKDIRYMCVYMACSYYVICLIALWCSLYDYFRAGHLQTALSFLLNAKDYALPEIEVEWARYKNTQVVIWGTEYSTGLIMWSHISCRVHHMKLY